MGYKARLLQTDKEKAAGAVELAVLEAKSSVDSLIASENLKGAKLNAALQASLAAEPFDIEKVIRIKGEIATANARKAAAEEILSSEFAD